MRIAFYAPMKPPDHAVPSGDRQMARNFMRALTLAGFGVDLVSRLRSYRTRPDIAALKAEAAAEQERLLAHWRTAPRPDLWFTYHPYYRAPDLIGPSLARRSNIRYVTAEASHAEKRDLDEWRDTQAPVADAVRLADLNICLTQIDREGLARLVSPERLADLPPFIDFAPFDRERKSANSDAVRLITVAMMRRDAKLDSYRALAQALSLIPNLPWSLTVIGDGPARPEVEAAFNPIEASRIAWLGEIGVEQVPEHLAQADLFAWPGLGEAYGLAYLEAQAAGLPVAAMQTHGVPAVVRAGTTGVLTPPNDIPAHAHAIADLIADRAKRVAMGAAARAFVGEDRSIAAAARTLRDLLFGLARAKSPRSVA